MTSALDKLTELFREFPGIGPRQARRFVHYLLTREANYINSLTSSLNELKESVTQCNRCYAYHLKSKLNKASTCIRCSNDSKDQTTLMLVEKDVDAENIAKSGTYNGLFFIMGGLLPILEKSPERAIRINQLKTRLDSDDMITEVIFAFSANRQGDNTQDYLETHLVNKYMPKIKFSSLGRGLSTGTELEYSDGSTLISAITNRR